MNRYKVVICDMFGEKNVFIDANSADEAVHLALIASNVFDWTVKSVMLDTIEVEFKEPFKV